jgi:CzcA family heavy metal efflux pump
MNLLRAWLRLILQNPMATGLGVVVTGLLGVYATFHLPVDLFPNLDVPVVNIITHYPGATPEDMELLITRPVENEMRGIPGVKRVASLSTQGLSQVTVELTWGTSILDARQLVQTRLAQVRPLLPQGTNPRLESIGTTLQEVVGYVVYGAGDPITLRTVIQLDLSSRLMGVSGVSSIEVLGGDRRAFMVRLSPAALRRTSLTVDDVLTALRRQNQVAVVGFVERGAREYLIRGDARIQSLDELRALPVGVAGTQPILLAALAKVSEARAPRHYVVHGNGVPAVAFVVRKQPGASTMQVVRAVDGVIANLHGTLPPGAQVRKFYDQSEIISEARDTILHDLLLGALLAIAVLYIFLGAWRPTLIVAVTIPITFAATLALMWVWGVGLNVITMSALTLAVGMIVDDAIVVAENIFRHRQMGKAAPEASLDGAAEIASADASGTLTTIAAFLPLVIITGLASLFLMPFGLTISLALGVSLLLSLTVVPLLLSRSSRSAPRRAFIGTRVLRWADTALQAILRLCFRLRWVVMALAVLSLSGGVLTAFLGRMSVLPPIDEGAILIEYVMPAGTALSESNRLGNLLERLALAVPDVATVYRRTGSPATGFQIEGVNRGELWIKLQPKTVRTRSATEIMAALKQAYTDLPGVVFLYHQPTQEKIDESFSGLPALFGVTIFGAETDTLVSLAQAVERILTQDPAISNVVNHTKISAPEIHIRPRYTALAQYGATVGDVLTTLQAARVGVEAFRIVKQKEEISVLVRVAHEALDTLQALRMLPIRVGADQVAPLRSLADIQMAHASAAITRLNGQREVTLLAEVEGNIPAVAARLQERFRSLTVPPGYSIEVTGQYKTLVRTALEMLLTVLMAVVLIFGIMAVAFGSVRQPLIILATLPLSLVGALLALFLSGQGVDVSVGMGVVTLVGIAVNNAIVLLDYANRRLAAGASRRDALLTAASIRLRPILLTALTTIGALIPTAIGSAVGSHIFQPFAITVIGGLLSATVATLIIVPTLALGFSPTSPTAA